MKIAVCHSYYSDGNSSGENNMNKIQIEILRQSGHEVKEFFIKTDTNEFFFRIRASFRVLTGFGRNPLRDILAFEPHILIVNNLFPNFGTQWLKYIKVPIIYFLHNYRFICSAGTFYLNNKNCFRCIEKTAFQALFNRCYKNSFFATLPLAFSQLLRTKFGMSLIKPSTFVTLSDTQFDIFSRSNYLNLRTIPNTLGLSLQPAITTQERSSKWLIASRLDTGKGVAELLHFWPRELEIDIYGDGPEYANLSEKFPPEKFSNIRLLGKIQKEELLIRIKTYKGAIFPSRTKEPGPLAFIEYVFSGLPVIALENSSVASIIKQYKCGEVLNEFSTDLLRKATNNILNNYINYCENALNLYKDVYSPENWLNQFNLLVNELLSQNKI